MKLNGIIGKGTGKLGSSVFAISGGEQIVREYNPNVSNPNTDAQVAQRAKLKLMSQLAAVLAPALGFSKMGLVSARNQFVSRNIGFCEYSENSASCNVTELQLTSSSIPFPGLVASPGDQGVLEVALVSAAPADVKRVAYFVYRQTDNDKLVYVASKIVSEAGASNNFPTTFNNVEGNLVVYAYGIKDDNAQATMKYEDYVSEGGVDAASLDVISLFRSSGYKLTSTVGIITEVQ